MYVCVDVCMMYVEEVQYVWNTSLFKTNKKLRQRMGTNKTHKTA